jgi:hypothetical protein
MAPQNEEIALKTQAQEQLVEYERLMNEKEQ